MNKTVNINLGGLFFHIDEDAYQKLTRYFEAIKRSLSKSGGQDEIMNDIELRISEIFSENKKNDKEVISLKDVDAMIAIMGQPEDYKIEEEETEQAQSNYQATKKTKKLYRDIDKNFLGGVAAGLGHYFKIDAIWIRLLFVLFILAGVGFPIFLYILLWILIPKAITTSEKLEMTGEEVNLSNIEKKARADYENNPEKKNIDKIGDTIAEIFRTIFNFIAKIIGLFVVLFSSITLISLVIGLFAFGSITFSNTPLQGYYDAVIISEFPIWTISILTFLAIGIPAFFLLILGLKILIPTMRSIGSIAKYVLLSLWIIAIAILVFFGVKQATEEARDGKIIEKTILSISPTDTLEIAFVSNDFYKSDSFTNNFELTEDESGKEIIYSNNIDFEVLPTTETQPYLTIERKAVGKSISLARKRAENIKYSFKFEGNKLILDDFFITDLKNKYRQQQVDIYLYLPKGIYFKPDASVQDFDESDDDYFNLHFSNDNYIYQTRENKVFCLNCPPEENEFNDVEWNENVEDTLKSISIKINDEEIFKGERKNQKVKLELNENGILTKK